MSDSVVERDNLPDWALALRARGWHRALLTALDMFEPLAPLMAQLLWVGQPVAMRWGAGWHKDALQGIALGLESGAGRAQLRQYFDEDAGTALPAPSESTRDVWHDQ